MNHIPSIIAVLLKRVASPFFICKFRINTFVNGVNGSAWFDDIKPHPIDQGAIDDLASGGWTETPFSNVPRGKWNDLPDLASQLPAHTIVGVAHEWTLDPEIRALWEQVLQPCGFTLDRVFQSESFTNDRIVKRSSQAGGLTGANTQDFYLVDHFNILGSSEVISNVKSLLEEPLPSTFFTTGP